MYRNGMEKINKSASAQSDEDLRYPLTESFRSVEYIGANKRAKWDCVVSLVGSILLANDP